MIQTVLFFSLGFLCAGFLALMVAPALWRRAVTLTRKRIEASVPLTLDEVQADKDQMRAEFAMSTRRLEMSIKSFKDKAANQIVEINRNRDELKRLSEERDEQNKALNQLEARASELRTELSEREERLLDTSARLEAAERKLEERAAELDKLENMYEEASFASSNRQIELVTRETEIDKLNGDIGTLRNERREYERQMREAVVEKKSLDEALDAEKKRADGLQKKLDRMTTTLSDREEKLERREKDLARLREELKEGSESADSTAAQLVEAQQEKVRLESELAEMSLQMSTLLEGAKGGDVEKAVEKLTAERERLETRLTALLRENKKLRGDLSAHQRAHSQDWSDERRENAILREQINDLAAEVVNLTAMLDGPDSPLSQAIATEAPAANGDVQRGETVTSLADRVRALQKAAAAAY